MLIEKIRKKIDRFLGRVRNVTAIPELKLECDGFLQFTRRKTHGLHRHSPCRGIVTADVLAKGLSRRAIATRKLKGVNRYKGHKRFLY